VGDAWGSIFQTRREYIPVGSAAAPCCRRFGKYFPKLFGYISESWL
jgi:hypothetical protein